VLFVSFVVFFCWWRISPVDTGRTGKDRDRSIDAKKAEQSDAPKSRLVRVLKMEDRQSRLGDPGRSASRCAMHKPWVILTRRYGDDVRNPTARQLAEAVSELYHETIPDAEHGSVFIRYGYDDGPMFVLDLDRLHQVVFEEWADQDFGAELAPPRKIRDVSEMQASQLLGLLADGQIDRVRSQSWE
jgi:hypothetical protein